jgi:dethiobiotin synthetase
MSKTFFITGTDTDAGKTVIAAALLRAAQARGLTTLGLKPVAAGGYLEDEKFVNEDAWQSHRTSPLRKREFGSMRWRSPGTAANRPQRRNSV